MLSVYGRIARKPLSSWKPALLAHRPARSPFNDCNCALLQSTQLCGQGQVCACAAWQSLAGSNAQKAADLLRCMMRLEACCLAARLAASPVLAGAAGSGPEAGAVLCARHLGCPRNAKLGASRARCCGSDSFGFLTRAAHSGLQHQAYCYLAFEPCMQPDCTLSAALQTLSYKCQAVVAHQCWHIRNRTHPDNNVHGCGTHTKIC